MRLVLDSNVWLDWLHFDDPCIASLKQAKSDGAIEIVIDAPCRDELQRVLGYGRFGLNQAAQSDLLSEADRFDVPIIANEDKGKTVSEIVLHVNYQLRKRFKSSATDVFGLRADDFGCGEKDDWRELVPALAG